MAVGAPSLPDPRYLRAVLEISLRGLPHAFRDVRATAGEALALDVSGNAGGQWTLLREEDRWTLHAGAPASPTTRAQLSDTTAWKLLFNALSQPDAAAAVRVEGRSDLAKPLLDARSVIV